MYMGDGGEICLNFSTFAHTSNRRCMEGEKSMKMTKDEAKSLAKKGVEISKKYGIPLKPKKEKTK
jgi:hypothetical protein